MKTQIVKFKGISNVEKINLRKGSLIEREEEYRIPREWGDLSEKVMEINHKNKKLISFKTVKRGKDGQGTDYINEISYEINKKKNEINQKALSISVGQDGTWLETNPVPYKGKRTGESRSIYLNKTFNYDKLNEFLEMQN